MFKIYYKSTLEDELQELPSVQENCWIHLDEATVSDIKHLAQITGIDDTDLLDCLDKYEIPRVEKNGDNLLVFTRFPSELEVGLYTSTLTLILTKDIFISVCPHSCLFIRAFLETGKFTTLSRTKLLIQLLMRINWEFTSHIRHVRSTVLSAEKEMISVESEDIAVLTKTEEVLNQYLSSLTPTKTVINVIRSGRYTKLYEPEDELLEDCLNSINQSEELCAIVLKSIQSLRDAYQIIFTNNLHKTIKLLTSLTIILSIPTMIASVYGMNVNLPLEKSNFAFVIIMAFTILLSIFGLWIFKKRGWL